MTRRIPRSQSVRSLHQFFTTIDHPTRSSVILSVPAAGGAKDLNLRVLSRLAPSFLFTQNLQLTTENFRLSPASLSSTPFSHPDRSGRLFSVVRAAGRWLRSEEIPAPSIPARNSVDHLHLHMNVILNPPCGKQAALFAGEGSQPPRLATTSSDSFLFT
jgi:hypothetical protein